MLCGDTHPPAYRPLPIAEPLERRSLLTTTFAASIDFSPDAAAMPVGYVADTGAPLTARPDGLTFGWDQDVSRRAGGRVSDLAPDGRYETFIAPKRANWDIAVPNGNYVVRVVAGDGKAGRRAKVDVEGVRAIDGKSTKDQRWIKGTVTVSVSDGLLTVSPGDGYKNNRLAYIDILPGPDAPVIAWEQTTIAAPKTRVEAAVAHLGSKVYIMGGYVDGFEVDNTTDVFDAATGTWSAGPDFPGSQTHAGVASDGVRYIYKVAGQVGAGVPGTPTADAWRLDTQTGRWDALPALPDVRYAPGMVWLDDRLHVFGGDAADRTTVTDTHWVLDLNDLAAGWVAKAPLPEAGDHMSTAVIGGQVYAIGGEHGHATHLPEGDAAYVQHPFLFRYDPATDAWTRLADVPTGRSHAEGTTIVLNGKIVMMGGKLNPTQVSDAVEVYDPAANVWRAAGPLPRANQGGAAIFHGGRIYLAYGQEGAPDHTMLPTLWVGTVTVV